MRIDFAKQINQLVKKVCVQHLENPAQLLGRVDHPLYCSSLTVEGCIGTGQMVANKFLETAMMELIGDFLEGRNIAQHLIELAAYALAVLGDKAGNTTGGNNTSYQNDTVKNSAHKIHDCLIMI